MTTSFLILPAKALFGWLFLQTGEIAIKGHNNWIAEQIGHVSNNSEVLSQASLFWLISVCVAGVFYFLFGPDQMTYHPQRNFPVDMEAVEKLTSWRSQKYAS